MDRRIGAAVKPAAFDYVAPTSLLDAVQVLAADEDASVIAGGQSLMPLLTLRLAHPSVLVDINGLGLDSLAVDCDHTTVRIGALVRHRRLELDAVVSKWAPLLASAARLIGYPAIRNWGTIGGSLAHADPVAEIPAVLMALGGSVAVTGARGERVIPAADLFEGFLTTSLAPDEIITEVRLPVMAGASQGAAFCEWAPRLGDFAEVGVGVALALDGTGSCTRVAAAACGVAAAPLDLGPIVAGAGVGGATAPTDGLLRSVASAVTGACQAAGDDRSGLAGLLAARAVLGALARAADSGGVAG